MLDLNLVFMQLLSSSTSWPAKHSNYVPNNQIPGALVVQMPATNKPLSFDVFPGHIYT